MMIRRYVCFSLLVLFAVPANVPALAAETGIPLGSYEAGEFTITLQEGGAFRVVHANGGGVTGRYQVAGNQVEITDQEGDFVCPDGVGKYTWKAEEDKLVFTLVEDPCDGRSRVLTAQPLVRDRLAGLWKGTWDQSAGPHGTFEMKIERKSDGTSAGTIRVEAEGAELYSAVIKETSLSGNRMSARYDSPDGQAEILLEGEWSDNSIAGDWSYRPAGESSYTSAGTWKASRQ